MIVDVVAAISLAVWLYLVFARGAFWRCAERDDVEPEWARLDSWPTVAAVIPARNEADSIGGCIASLVRQDYPGDFTVNLVDDDSNDGTGAIARQAAAEAGRAARLNVIKGSPLPSGWTGKLWAVKQGIKAACAMPQSPTYLLLTDADIVYRPGVLTQLVARAERENLVLSSLMVKLRCESLAERGLIPAFIFFFQMLYPFALVNRTGNATAGAAGGCMLVRADALEDAGGIDAIRNALIDDCALAGIMKARGPIRLALTEKVESVRPYPDVAEIRKMVARSAYAQLRYSPLLLAGTVLGMTLTYLVPVLTALFASGIAQWLGLATWLLMAIAFQPTLRLYRVSPLWGLALPAIALCYMLFTLDSALKYARGQGGLWKGRIQATRS